VHESLLRQIESLGYATSVHRMGEYVELHGVPLPAGEPVRIVRVDGDGEEQVYRAARALAEMVGIGLEG
jgi:hypothetical protein